MNALTHRPKKRWCLCTCTTKPPRGRTRPRDVSTNSSLTCSTTISPPLAVPSTRRRVELLNEIFTATSVPNTHRVMRSWAGQARRMECAKRRPTTKQCVFVAHVLKKDGNRKTTFRVGSQFVPPTQEWLHASHEDGMQHLLPPFMGA